MVAAVRAGRSAREVAREFGVSHATVLSWVERARRKALARVDFGDRPSGAAQPWNRTEVELETRIAELRRELKEKSILGECGAKAIREALLERNKDAAAPSVRTIGRILERQGLLDGRKRIRRPPPPKGWYLADLAKRSVELDSFDVVEDLKIEKGPLIDVLTGISLHGGWAAAWPDEGVSARGVVERLKEHWAGVGLPAYAQFDNDTRFQGAHQHANTFGRVTRMCLSLGVTPVFAPPRESGFQAAVESFNGQWQAKVWKRWRFAGLQDVRDTSAQYIAAHRARSAVRQAGAPERRVWPKGHEVDLQAPLKGRAIYIRRTDEGGRVSVLGRVLAPLEGWPTRLVRCEVDFDEKELRLYALRRRAPEEQPLLRREKYQPPTKRFDDK